jgi:hypothetical protein
MALRVTFNDQTIFRSDDGGNVLAPSDKDERAKAFHALTGALAILAGVTPLSLRPSIEAVKDQHSEETPQYPAAQTGGVVVPLRGRRDNPTQS